MDGDEPGLPEPARGHGVADRLLVIGVVALGLVVVLLALGARPVETSRPSATPAAQRR
jgi:hypothetical protein